MQEISIQPPMAWKSKDKLYSTGRNVCATTTLFLESFCRVLLQDFFTAKAKPQNLTGF